MFAATVRAPSKLCPELEPLVSWKGFQRKPMQLDEEIACALPPT
jgi:hypothetical protein